MRRRITYVTNASLPKSICFAGFKPVCRLRFTTIDFLRRQSSTAWRNPPNVNSFPRNVSSSTSATVHIGNAYEHLCLRVLARLGFSLTRTGGRSDKGIDLLGLWSPPVSSSASSPLRVVVQCKAYTRQVYPALIRELEGAVAGAPGEWRSEDTIGVLCAPKGATGGIRDAMRMAERGVVWVTIGEILGAEEDVHVEGRVSQLLWNGLVRKVVKDGLGAGLRYVPGAKGLEQEVVLMLNGRIWEAESTFDEGAQKGQDLEKVNSTGDKSSS